LGKDIPAFELSKIRASSFQPLSAIGQVFRKAMTKKLQIFDQKSENVSKLKISQGPMLKNFLRA
jgi:hypothetical protein